MWMYRESVVPWVKEDVHERLKTMTVDDFPVQAAANVRGGAAVCWNGSVFLSGQSSRSYRREATEIF